MPAQGKITPQQFAAQGAVCNYIDPPFLPAIECVMDLPFPPSVNHAWTVRGRGIVRAKQYMAWKRYADMAAVANGSWRRRVVMPGNFTALILLDNAQRGGCDCDNRIKPVLDWAQNVELIKNDNLCDEVTARWVPTPEAPSGCRLVLRSIA